MFIEKNKLRRKIKDVLKIECNEINRRNAPEIFGKKEIGFKIH